MNPSTSRLGAVLMAVALVAAVATASCESDDRQVFHVSGAEYSSVEELTLAADVVVVATANDTARHVVEGGIPVVYREFAVDEVIFDSSGFVGEDTIDVSLFDTDELVVEQQSDIVEGQRLLLFLDQVSVEEVAAIKPLAQVFSPLSSDNAIFDVSDSGAITPRSRAITKMRAADTARSDFTGTLDAVREVTAEAKP